MLTAPLRDRFGIIFRLATVHDGGARRRSCTSSAEILGDLSVTTTALRKSRRARAARRESPTACSSRVRDYAQVRGDGRYRRKTSRSEALEHAATIDDLGLDRMDIATILRAMMQKFGGASCRTRHAGARRPARTLTTIEDVYEPYLLQLGFIMRTPAVASARRPPTII